MTTLEFRAVSTSAARMPTLTTEPPIVGVQGSRVVVDCPATAWDDSDQEAILNLRHTFGDDQVGTYESDLRRAAHVLIETHLDSEWANREFVAVYVRNMSAYESGATPGPDGTTYFVPADEVYHEVWQAAANAITDKDIVRQADLGHVFQMSTDLERRRAALRHRLNELAETAECPHAEAQVDGWNAAVDAAVSPAQLVEISALIA